MKHQSLFVKALKQSDSKHEAFTRLVQEYKERLYWHIRKIVLDHDDANDVVQNTFIKVHLNIENFNENSTLFTWMYRIATNEALNFIKSKAKKFLMSSKEMMDYQINNLKEDPYFDGDELQISLQKAINSLPTKQKLIFQMKYEQNMKFKEIAEILETSEGGLKASYHIAVKKIKKELLKNQTF